MKLNLTTEKKDLIKKKLLHRYAFYGIFLIIFDLFLTINNILFKFSLKILYYLYLIKI
jgi:hypothetical protein